MFTEKYNPKIKGILHLDIFKSGSKISEESHNTITDTSPAILARLIGMQGTYSDKAITTIKISNGDAPAAKTNTDLDGTEDYSNAIVSVDYSILAPNEVQFNFIFDASEFNGYDVWQFGLFTGDGKMFSMLSRNPSKSYPIEKDADVTIHGWWKIIFANS
jgi:hypothetical protein